MTKTVYFIIPEYGNRQALTIPLVESIHDTAPDCINPTILIGDDAWLERQPPVIGAVVVQHLENHGYTGNINSLMNHVEGDENTPVFLLNTDVLFLPDTIGKLLIDIWHDWIIGPRLVVPQSIVNRPGAHDQYIFEPNDDTGIDRNSDMIAGCCIGLKLGIWRALGGLDPMLKHYYSDDDFFVRAYRQGYKFGFRRDAYVRHYVGGTYRSLPGSILRKFIKEDMAYFKEKHPDIEWKPGGKYIWKERGE